MSEHALYTNLMRLGLGIEACLEKKLVVPSLILLYSGIDTAGWLDSPERNSSRASFLAWVDRYLLKAKPLACTALDLYAARCGLLHTLTAESAVSRQGKARRIVYAWGTASVSALQRTTDLTGQSSEHVAVHVNDLYEGWRLGLLDFTNDLEHDPARKRRVSAKARQFFSDMGVDFVRDALGILDSDAEPA